MVVASAAGHPGPLAAKTHAQGSHTDAGADEHVHPTNFSRVPGGYPQPLLSRMSYLVLARKWRPLSFSELVGQDSVVRTLTNALEQGRVAHAYVFSGPRGVGKTTTARILSRALNCEKGPTPTPCGVCPACTAITEGSAVDVIEIDGASNRGINEIRELREAVRYAPSSGKYKVYIIDEVHMLTKEAFNALLKTLEEPPAHVVFIFATTSPKNIPVTVLSRCQHLSFRRIPKARIMEHLAFVSEQEKVTITPGALEMLARVSEGSVRDSLTVLDQAMAFSMDIREEDLQAMLGLPERGLLYELAGLLLRGDRAGILQMIQNLSDAGHDLRAFPKELVSLFRNLMVVKIAERPASLLELPEDEILDLKALAEESEVEELTLMLNEFLNLEGQIRSVTMPRYLMELSFIRASFLKGSTSLQSILDRLQSGGGTEGMESTPPRASVSRTPKGRTAGSGPGPAQTAAPETASEPESRPAANPGNDAGAQAMETSAESLSWNDVVRRVDQTNHPLAIKLSQGKVEGTHGGALQVAFAVENPDFFIGSLRRSLQEVEKAASELAGRKVRVNFVAAEVEETDRVKTGAELRNEISKDPIVQSAIEIFDAKVVDVRPLEGLYENGGN